MPANIIILPAVKISGASTSFDDVSSSSILNDSTMDNNASAASTLTVTALPHADDKVLMDLDMKTQPQAQTDSNMAVRGMELNHQHSSDLDSMERLNDVDDAIESELGEFLLDAFEPLQDANNYKSNHEDHDDVVSIDAFTLPVLNVQE